MIWRTGKVIAAGVSTAGSRGRTRATAATVKPATASATVEAASTTATVETAASAAMATTAMLRKGGARNANESYC
jgi:hypothetical protein